MPNSGAPLPATAAASHPDAAAIRLRGLTKRYGAGPMVLQGIDLTVAPGERIALIGANGSGKSTLLRCLIGLQPATTGQIEVLGQTLGPRPRAADVARLRREIGFVFQKHCLVRRRSALSNVVHGMMGLPGSWRAFSQALAPEAWRQGALAALADVGLAERALERADALSGGQQQRVAIARALVRRPRLVIADEPAASLDPAAGRDVMDLFSRLVAGAGITLFFTSHDMAHARDFADRVVAIRQGKIFFDQPAADLGDKDLADVFA